MGADHGRVGAAETGSHPSDQALLHGLGAPRFDPARIGARIAELRKMKGHDASDIWIIRSEIAWLEEKLGAGR